MIPEYCDDDLLDLGVASIATKGGAMGYEDHEGTLWVRGGLTDD
jgi:hypothetical protein